MGDFSHEIDANVFLKSLFEFFLDVVIGRKVDEVVNVETEIYWWFVWKNGTSEETWCVGTGTEAYLLKD